MEMDMNMDMASDMVMDMVTDKNKIEITRGELSVPAHQHEPNFDQGSCRQKILLCIYIF
jgi:hypothetical protein